MYSILLMMSALGPAVPPVTAGPDFAAQAVAVDAPIDRVTVFSDRAQVVRSSAPVTLSNGWQGVRLPDLPGATLLPTVRLEAKGARVLRVEVTPVERERLTLEEAETWVATLEDLASEQAKIDGTLEILDAQAKALRGLAPAPVVDEAQRDGRPPPSIDPRAWKRGWDYRSKLETTLLEQRVELRVARKKLVEKANGVRKQLGQIDMGALSERRVQVVAVVRPMGKARPRFELSYFLPGASWKPKYELRFDPKAEAVRLVTTARVRQATGESWNNVELGLSTAIPGQSIVVPELLTWTLGEANELIPKLRPRVAPPVPKRHAAPSSLADASRTLHWRLLQKRMQNSGVVFQPGGSGTEYKKKTVVSFDDDTIEGELGTPDGAYGK